MLYNADQIKFLLEANGINFNTGLEKESKLINQKIYLASNVINASLYLYDGNYILKAGSIIKNPSEERRKWSDGGKFYIRFKNKFEELIETNQAELIDENSAKLLNDLVCNSPSFAGALCTGYSTNGWEFWKGLSEERYK